MKRAAKEKTLWPVLAVLALSATLPASASIPRDLPSRLTEIPVRDVPTPPPETASASNRFALYEIAVWADGQWRVPPRAPVAEAYAKTRVWGLENLCSTQRQENTGLKPAIAEGVCDGPSQYIFAGYDPINMGDPLGLEGGDRSAKAAERIHACGEPCDLPTQLRKGLELIGESATERHDLPGATTAYFFQNLTPRNNATAAGEVLAGGILARSSKVAWRWIRGLRNAGRRLNPFKWFEDLGEATSLGTTVR